MDTVNAKVKRPKAIWDLAAHLVFIEVCKEVSANNRPVRVLNRNGYCHVLVFDTGGISPHLLFGQGHDVWRAQSVS
jgi:hypothetical protein